MHGEHAAAVDTCVDAINRAAGMRFEEPPGFWGRLKNSVVGWISDHADFLQALSGVLKQISSIAGILAMIPVLAPVMGPIAVVAGGAAVAVDATVHAATGKGSLTDILTDAAGMIPFAKGVQVVTRAAKSAKAAKAVAAEAKDVTAVARIRAEAKDAKAIGAPTRDVSSATQRADGATGGTRAADDAGNAAATRTPPDRCTTAGDPINVVTGEMIMLDVDLELPGVLPLVLRRLHLSSYRWGSLFGSTWASTLEQRVETGDGGGACFVAEDGVVLYYPDAGTAEVGAAVLPIEGIRRWPLRRSDDGGWTVEDPDAGLERRFAAPDRGGRSRMLEMSDRHGNTIYFDHDVDGVVCAVRHSGGYHVDISTESGAVTAISVRGEDESTVVASFGYDASGNLVRVGNPDGEPMRFDCDDDSRIVQWTDRNNIWYRYEYDEAGRCVRTSGRGRVLSYGFSYLPGRTLVTNSLGAVTEYDYNATGQVVRQTNPLGHVTSSVWDRYDRLLLRTDAEGRTTQFSYDDQGRLTDVVYPDGRGETLVRNRFGLPLRVVDAAGAVWTRRYDDAGGLLAETDPTGAIRLYERDTSGAMIARTDPSGAVSTIENNPAGLPVCVVDPLGGANSFVYNKFGRLVRATDPLGGVTEYGWTAAGKIAWQIGPDGAREEWAWDGEGNLTCHTDAVGARTETVNGVFDLPVARTNPDGTRMLFGYDTELRLTSVQNPAGLRWRYEYDAAGRLVSETDFNGRQLTYRHDALGRLIGSTNALGQETCLRYDLAGDLVRRENEDGVADFAYDAAGRLVSAVSPGAVVHLDRDPVGRVLRETVNGRSVTSRFDEVGRRTGRVTPTGVGSEWSYDAAGRAVSLVSGGHSVEFNFDAAGREVGRVFSGGAVLSQQFDAAHRMTGQSIGVGADRMTTARVFTYRVDGALAGMCNEMTGSSRRFDLDPAGRVVGVQAATWSESYAYDPVGHLSEASFAGGRSDGAGGRQYSGTLITRAGNVTFGHDRQGRVVVRTRKRLSRRPETWRFAYDADDRMVSARSGKARWTYTYDAFGRRISKQQLDADGGVVAQVLFTWDGNFLIEQVILGSEGLPKTTTWDYSPGSWRPIAQTDSSAGDRQFWAVVSDLVGTPTELVSADGARVAWSNGESTLWGRAADTAGRAIEVRHPLPSALPGQYADHETGLNYNRHRYYDPVAARYTSADPLGLEPADDHHGYVPNPTGGADPLGLTASCSTKPTRFEVDSQGVATDEYVNLATPRRTEHILTGNDTGGGHLWPGLPGKTPFPKNWSGADVMHEVSDITTDPKLTWVQKTGVLGCDFTKTGKPSRFVVIGTRRGTSIKVVVEPAGEGIITAHPA